MGIQNAWHRICRQKISKIYAFEPSGARKGASSAEIEAVQDASNDSKLTFPFVEQGSLGSHVASIQY